MAFEKCQRRREDMTLASMGAQGCRVESGKVKEARAKRRITDDKRQRLQCDCLAVVNQFATLHCYIRPYVRG